MPAAAEMSRPLTTAPAESLSGVAVPRNRLQLQRTAFSVNLRGRCAKPAATSCVGEVQAKDSTAAGAWPAKAKGAVRCVAASYT